MTIRPQVDVREARTRHQLLAVALQRARIGYVYWKPRAGLARAVQGGPKDLDLLVGPAVLDRARECLRDYGYKPFLLPEGALPESEPWVAWSAAEDTFFHVHLHWGLHVGRPGLHEQTLPWVDALLASARLGPEGVHVLSAEAELALVATRAVFEPKLVMDSGTLASADTQTVICEARRGVDPTTLNALCARLFGDAGATAAGLLADPRFPAAPQAWRAWRAFVIGALAGFRAPRSELRWGLALVRSVGAVATRRALGGLADQLLLPPRSRLGRASGFLVALIGPDGAGKSTLTDALVGWLSELFSVDTLYLGRGEVVSRAQQLAAQAKWAVLERVTDRTRPTDPGRADSDGRRHPEATPREQRLRWLRDASALALAERKTRDLARARSMLRNGWILVADRFPHPTERLCDGPAIVLGDGDPPVRRALAHAERAMYARMTRRRPDLVVRLLLPVEESLRRKPDHRELDIRAKLAAAERAQYDAVASITVRADAPLDSVLRAIKLAMWEGL